jgi:hypothetical protein
MHMTLLGWRYADLARALVEIGVEEDEALLRNRIGLGRFRATLFLQCMMAMGVDELRLPLIIGEAEPDRGDPGEPDRPQPRLGRRRRPPANDARGPSNAAFARHES